MRTALKIRVIDKQAFSVNKIDETVHSPKEIWELFLFINFLSDGASHPQPGMSQGI